MYFERTYTQAEQLRAYPRFDAVRSSCAMDGGRMELEARQFIVMAILDLQSLATNRKNIKMRLPGNCYK